mmetsp:Transcript_4867/g.10173  ORF Transcript_4867/g.10173 Transcript_4867/m.10173 type:complete len:113 (+) Transcript_4867:1497-1835(+)
MTAGEWKSIHRRFSSVDGSVLFLVSLFEFVAASGSPKSLLRFKKERLLVLRLLFPLTMESDVGGQKSREFMLGGLEEIGSWEMSTKLNSLSYFSMAHRESNQDDFEGFQELI